MTERVQGASMHNEADNGMGRATPSRRHQRPSTHAWLKSERASYTKLGRSGPSPMPCHHGPPTIALGVTHPLGSRGETLLVSGPAWASRAFGPAAGEFRRAARPPIVRFLLVGVPGGTDFLERPGKGVSWGNFSAELSNRKVPASIEAAHHLKQSNTSFANCCEPERKTAGVSVSW